MDPWLQLYLGCMSLKLFSRQVCISMSILLEFLLDRCVHLITVIVLSWPLNGATKTGLRVRATYVQCVCTHTHTHTYTERNTCCKSADRKIKQSLQLLQMRALLKLYACSKRYKLKFVWIWLIFCVFFLYF